jgi:metal-sulfur cluster biosynthetic enzyme
MVTQEEVIEKLKNVMDPHTAQSVYDMGLIEDLTVDGDLVKLTFKPSSPFCPIGMQLAVAIKKAVREAGAKEIEIKVVDYIRDKEVEEMLKEV